MIVRFRFAKIGKIRWTSQRDVARMWERALRRAGLPVAYTGGFSPRPQLSFGLALPTGCESLAEYLDVAFSKDVEPSEVADLAGALLPSGIGVLGAREAERSWGSLQEAVTSCTWEIQATGTRDELERAVSKAMVADTLPVSRQRKGKVVSDDLRPSLLAMWVAGNDTQFEEESHRQTQKRGAAVHETPRDSHRRIDAHPAHSAPEAKIVAELGTRPRGVRPAELADVMAIELGSVRRTCQWIERDGSKFEPLEPRVAVADFVERAS